ncbi:hypothetical protein ACFSQ7_44895 [Paenibacillus rhizoplanae]
MYGDELLARIEDSMSEINFNTIERTDLILHLIDTLLLAHKAFYWVSQGSEHYVSQR